LRRGVSFLDLDLEPDLDLDLICYDWNGMVVGGCMIDEMRLRIEWAAMEYNGTEMDK